MYHSRGHLCHRVRLARLIQSFVEHAPCRTFRRRGSHATLPHAPSAFSGFAAGIFSPSPACCEHLHSGVAASVFQLSGGRKTFAWPAARALQLQLVCRPLALSESGWHDGIIRLLSMPLAAPSGVGAHTQLCRTHPSPRCAASRGRYRCPHRRPRLLLIGSIFFVIGTIFSIRSRSALRLCSFRYPHTAWSVLLVLKAAPRPSLPHTARL